MANRHQLRTVLMQSLYESEFHPDQNLPDVVERQVGGAELADADRKYIDQAVAGLQEHAKDIDGLITTNAPEWPLDQIAAIDRAVLRLGIYEVMYSDEVPPKVAINEAVEIAKNYPGLNYGATVEVRPVAPECAASLRLLEETGEGGVKEGVTQTGASRFN